MSHFTVVEIEATDASCLIDALEACGYKGKIEVHDRPATLIRARRSSWRCPGGRTCCYP
jgi:hypothetical protein